MIADAQRELAEAHLPEVVSRWAAEGFRDIGGLSARVLEARLIERLLPTVQALIADAEKRAAARARREQQLWDRRRVEDYAAVVGVELSPGDDTIAAVDELYRAALDPSGAAEGAGR